MYAEHFSKRPGTMTQTRADSTFETILDHVLPFAGPALISDQGPLRNAARQLPPVPYGTLEVRLEQGDVQVDLSQGFPDRQFSLLACWLQEHGRGQWTQLNRFADALSIENGQLNKNIAAVGLEFDLNESNVSDLPTPSLWFIPKSSCLEDLRCFKDTLDAALSAIFPPGISKPLLSNARNLLETMPPNSRLHAVGTMLSRKTQALRFQFQNISSKNLKATLQRLNIDQELPGLNDAIKLQNQIDLPLSICLDLAPQLLPGVGLEFGGVTSKTHETPGGRLLDELVNNQLCCANKRSALESWTGVSIPSGQLSGWKLESVYANALKKQRLLVKIHRRISHVKLSIESGQCLKAKVYLDFFPEAVWLE